MKKLMAALLVTLTLAGCGGAAKETPKDTAKETPAAPTPVEQKVEPKGEMILATTTSTQDTGLLDVLLPEFTKQTGWTVKTVAVGSGAALAMAQKGEADAVLAHAPSSEKPLVDAGDVTNYHQIMHNDFVIVGPAADPAGIKGKPVADAMKAIAAKPAVFVSRGDNSGTNSKENELWKTAGITPSGDWFLKSGTGMGATLAIANDKVGYTLTDRATYLAQKNNLKLNILVEGDKSLLNIYHVMQVNPTKFSKVKGAAGEAFVNFMLKPETMKIITSFGVDKYGGQLFYSDL
jgi:tungstate transport system substrate-binding protein